MPRIAHPAVKRCRWKLNRWFVDGVRNAEGKRFRRFFETKEAAQTWLANFREQTLVEGRSGMTLTTYQRADARRALLELAPFKGATLTDAAKNYADLLQRTERTVPVMELVTMFIGAKEQDGRSNRYLLDLRSRLGTFKESFGDRPTAAISTRDLDDWLRALPVGPQSRVNYRRVLHALFNFACARDLVRDNPVTRTERPKIIPKEPGILTPAQFRRLLDTADDRLRPALAIGGFAGLRPAEVRRLTWEAVDLEQKHISVSAMASKTASRRLVPISDNLLAWLMRAPRKTGSVSLVSVHEERQLTLAARKAAGIKKWPTDALRHSWVSYRFALTRDAARTASEAGHDVAVLHRHYRALATHAEAERWFAILPGEKAAETVPFESVAAEQ